MPEQKKLSTGWKILYAIIGVLILGVVTVITVGILYRGGDYPSGSDVYAHLYKGERLYHEILDGNYYPLYDEYWYNGVQMMRYWAPLPVYVLALLIGLCSGEVFYGYLLFVAVVLFFGGLSWLSIGLRRNRPVLGIAFSVLWFFLPINVYALFGEGNLPRSLSMIFLPLFMNALYGYLLEKNLREMKWLILTFFLMACCHTGYAGMLALAVLVYLLVYRIGGGRRRAAWDVICGIIIGYLLLGIWLYASLQGGITSGDRSEVMKGFFQSILITLNPFYRLTVTETVFYFGLSLFLIAVFAIFAAKKQIRTGMITAIIICLLTTTPAYSLLSILPGAQYLWMLRFIAIAVCMILMSMMYWTTLRKWILVLMIAVIALDCIPSYQLYTSDGEKTAVERIQEESDAMLAEEAREITDQRIALLDGSSTGSRGQYILTALGENLVDQTFGAGWESSATAKNIVTLNQAVEDGYYTYLFDRTLAMGDDTVLIKKSELAFEGAEEPTVTASAELSGYELVDSNDSYLLYHREIGSRFGVVSTYRTLGIGSDIATTAMTLPDMKEADSTNLNDFTAEELEQYNAVYIAGFTYDDKTAAEEMLREVSESGTYVIIYGDGIPADEHTRTTEFLGVSAQTIEFENGYPILYYKGEKYDPMLFDRSATEWHTVYLNGLTEETGYIEDNGLELAYIGTGENDHLVFVGLNLSYHYALTKDEEVGAILNDAIGDHGEALPTREIVPLDIEVSAKSLTITSPADDVNTTLAYHDIFQSEGNIWSENQLLYVDAGTTVIEFQYPYLVQGIVLEVVAVVLLIIFLMRIRKRRAEGGNVEQAKNPHPSTHK